MPPPPCLLPSSRPSNPSHSKSHCQHCLCHEMTWASHQRARESRCHYDLAPHPFSSIDPPFCFLSFALSGCGPSCFLSFALPWCGSKVLVFHPCLIDHPLLVGSYSKTTMASSASLIGFASLTNLATLAGPSSKVACPLFHIKSLTRDLRL